MTNPQYSNTPFGPTGRRALHLLSALILFLACTSLQAEPIDSTAARRTASAFFLKGRGEKSTKALLRKEEAQTELVKATDAAFVFRDGEKAFVVVAADDRLPAILGYGRGGSKEVPAPMKSLLESYSRALPFVRSVNYSYDGGPAVAPLLTYTRHQEYPYNAACPYYTDDAGTVSSARCVVGCVATALEEVVTFHRRVVTLQDTLHGWSTAHYVIPDVLPGTMVDTRLIVNDYSDPSACSAEAIDAVSRLSFYLGMASHMNWGLWSSGASLSTPPEALRRAFGFGFVHYADSYKYRPEDWFSMLRGEMRASRPVVFSGHAMRMNGHAFVLDGLDADGLFHVNWGVSGDYDGYFRLDILAAGEPEYDMTASGTDLGYFTNQQAILLHPDAVSVSLPDTLARTGEEVVVDSAVLDFPIEIGKESPLHLFLRNTADYSTTTPLEIFTNAPSDTALFQQGDYAALTSVTLQPGERKEVVVYLRLNKAGDRTLSISPDDVHIIHSAPVSVLEATEVNLTLDEPYMLFPADSTAVIVQRYVNAEGGGRTGERTIYEIFEGENYIHNGTSHTTHCFLQPGEEKTDSVAFRGLIPGQRYTIYVRYPWTIAKTISFTMPDSAADGIENVSVGKTTKDEIYDISGRRVKRQQRGGIYIRKGDKSRIDLGL